MRRGIKTKIILEKILDGVGESVNLFAAFLNAGYGASLNKIESELNKIKKREYDNSKKRTNFNSTIYKLKKDGLITKDDKKNYKITNKGKKKLKDLKEKLLPTTHYKKEKNEKLIIITFDIPEKERRKRDWLRRTLENLDFKICQKSVWVGKNKIPESLIKDIQDLEISKFIDFFEATKLGTLKK